jgi:hypothetical protein
MPLYNFDPHQEFISIDKLPDLRSDEEKLNSPLSSYNHQSNDLAYAERLAEEIVNISGAWITVFPRQRNQASKDEVWDEDADPVYSNGVKIKGKLVPEPTAIQLTRWGVDTPNKTTVHFSRANVFKLFGKHMIGEGDVLIIPHNTLAITQSTDLRDGPMNRIDSYRVLQSGDTGNFKYRWLYWSVVVENLTGDRTIQVDQRRDPS